jgi:hypothetical protein
VVLALALKLLQ